MSWIRVAFPIFGDFKATSSSALVNTDASIDLCVVGFLLIYAVDTVWLAVMLTWMEVIVGFSLEAD